MDLLRRLPDHAPMKWLFMAYCLVEFHPENQQSGVNASISHDSVLNQQQHQHQHLMMPVDPDHLFDTLHAQYPDNAFLLALHAQHHYHHRRYDEARQLFERLRDAWPYSVDYLDIYSNILFVLEDQRGLCALAQQCLAVDGGRAGRRARPSSGLGERRPGGASPP